VNEEDNSAREGEKLRRIASSLIIAVLFWSMFMFRFTVLPIKAQPKDAVTTPSAAAAVNETVGLELTVQLEKTEYSLGEPVNITLILTNISNQTINLQMSAISFDFWILNDMNIIIFQYSTSAIFPLYIIWQSIAPGRNLTRVLVWPQTYYTIDGAAVPAGTYYMVGQFGGLQTYPLTFNIGVPALSYTLTITAAVGGTAAPASGTYSYIAYSLVQVTTVPEVGYSFDYWELDTINVGSVKPYTVLMNENHTLKAVFSTVKPSVPVGGYSIPIQVPTSTNTLATYIILTVILATAFTTIKRKRRKTQ
jgi:hypothetical protein